MAKENRFNDTPIEAVKEVREFEEVRARIQAFRDANPAFFQFLDPLIEEYNTKREAAEKEVRSRGISCGEFQLYQQYVTYDVDAIRNALGRDGFLAVGGTEKTVTKYELDKKRFEVAAKSGQVPQNVLETASKLERKFHQPRKIELP